MLPVSLSNLRSNVHLIQHQNNYKFQSIPDFSPKYNKTLNADTVSFQGQTVDKSKAKKTIENSKKRQGIAREFSEREINILLESVTPKNQEFLKDILELNKRKLGSGSVKKLLEYIDKPDTNVDVFRKRLERFNNLENIFNGDDCSPSILVNQIDKMSANVMLDLLMSDVLTPKHMQRQSKFNLLTTAYNYVADTYLPKQIKKQNDLNSKKGLPPLSEKEINELVAKIMRGPSEREDFPSFAHIIMLRTIYDEATCNELLDNRSKYINTIYIPRLKMLNDEDKALLLEICASGITDKHNKGGRLQGYLVSMDDKICTLNILAANREIINAGYEGINLKDYIYPSNIVSGMDGNIYVDYQGLKIDLMDKALRRIGVDDKVVDKYMKDFRQAYKKDPSLAEYRDRFWDTNYSHLINLFQKDTTALPSLLQDVIVAGTNGTFEDLLYKEGPIAERNKLNEKAFLANGINYQRWIKPEIAAEKRVFKSRYAQNDAKKEFSCKVWDRIPQKSLFDGNYTTCCTGIDKDQGMSFPHFLTNTATTTVEVRTEKDKVIGMSRLLMAKVNGKKSLIIENIEVNNRMVKHYLYDDLQKYRYREMIFDYVRKFAKYINNGEDMPVYFSGKYFKVKDIEKGLGESKRIDDVVLIGEYPDDIYINAYGSNYNRSRLAYADDGDGFAMTLIDITEKKPPIIDKKNNIASDTNYNYDDLEQYNQ